MKHPYLLLSLFFPLNFVAAQSVSVGTISKLTLCTGDTVWVPYSSNGSFKADNFFAVQLSDGNGSFAIFSNIGHATAGADSIPVLIGYAGDHYLVRVIATDPYTISANTSSDIQIVSYPSPNPFPNTERTDFGAAGFIGDAIKFQDASSESSGSTYLWSFDQGQDASIVWTTVSSPMVTYSTEGVKSGKLTVSNSAGCSTSKPFQLRILSCSPVIPDSVHIVTGTETGNHTYVWVKAGGNYTTSGEFSNTNVFVEPGASLRTDSRSIGLYYVKNDASFISNNGQGFATVVLNQGNLIIFNSHGNNVDTLYCDNLQFDYSLVGGAEVRVAENPLQILSSSNSLRVSCNGAVISASIVNL